MKKTIEMDVMGTDQPKGFLKWFVRHKIARYIAGIFLIIGVDVFMLFVPQYVGRLIDSIKYFSGTLEQVAGYIGAIMLFALGMFVTRFFWRIMIIGASRQFEEYVRNRLFRRLLTLSPSFYDKTKTGDMMARMTNDVNASRMMLAQGVIMLTDSLFLGTMAIIVMARTIDPRLTAIGILPLPFLAFMAVGFGKTIHHRFEAVQKSFSELTDVSQESLDGIRVVKNYVTEEERKDKFEKGCKQNFLKSLSLIRLWGLFFPMIEFLASMGTVLSLWYGGQLVLTGTISLGQFIAFIQYLGMLVWPMIAMGWVVNVIQRGRASYKRLLWVENQRSEVEEPTQPQKADLAEAITVKDLTFHYPGSEKKSLDRVNLQIQPGQTIAFVGKTGSGKTTLAKLLMKMYSVPKGTIFFGSQDIGDLSMKDIRQQVAYVPQETFLFSATIEENIAFSMDEYQPQMVENYAKLAAVHTNIEEFPNKYQTMVGERGITLSGGQKQRVAIARALIRKTPVVVLDDCLSAVDVETEMKILESLKTEISQRTTIIISHRLKAVAGADCIFVLDNGRIEESGSHDKLIKKKGLYAKLYEKQLLEEELQSEPTGEES